MATIKFRLRSKANKPVSIYVYISLGRGEMYQSKTGFTIHPKDWSSTTNKPKQNNPVNKKTFSNLQKLETYLHEQINISQAKSELIDLMWLKTKIEDCFSRVKKTDRTLLTNHIQFIIDHADTREIKGSNKIGLSQRRILGYKSFLSLIQRYEKHIKKKITFLDINYEFTNKFKNWLLKDQKYSVNYAGKNLDNLKTVSIDAKSNGIKVHEYSTSIKGFKEKNEDRVIVTLSFDELEAIEKADLKNEAHENARKWILLGCHLGQRVSDLMKLTPESFRYDESKGNYYIDVKQEKTKKTISQGVKSDYLINIIQNDFPYKVSSQILNKHIKKVCEAAGIDKNIKARKYDKESGRKILKDYPKYDLITSHCFRRSFATNYYNKIPLSVLIQITGHSKESEFRNYINRDESKEENADLFLKFYEEIHKERKENKEKEKDESPLRIVKDGTN